jgi:ABC-type multidrug transport system fused ATPase/permease subunit
MVHDSLDEDFLVEVCGVDEEEGTVEFSPSTASPPHVIGTRSNNNNASYSSSIPAGHCIIQSVQAMTTTPPKTILSQMSLNFPDNAVTAILGPSGSGKV